MTGTEPNGAKPEKTGGDGSKPAASRPGFVARLFTLRGTLPGWQSALFSILFLVLVFGLWALLTSPEEPAHERIAQPNTLPSPAETADRFGELWFDRALTRNTLVTLRRVILGFLLATAVGIPLGILTGCFAPANSFFLPLTVFGRNVPLAALIPITFMIFGIAETQKVMFIFIACVMFIAGDTATSIRDVSQRYVDTAYTLGASKRQVILKVLTPLALPNVFNSLRLLFGLAFGYIMLAETIKFGGEAGGLGDIIRQSQRRTIPEHIWTILVLIPVLAVGIDRGIYWIQRSLFPHRYGGYGLLNRTFRWLFGRWDDLKTMVFKKAPKPVATEGEE